MNSFTKTTKKNSSFDPNVPVLTTAVLFCEQIHRGFYEWLQPLNNNEIIIMDFKPKNIKSQPFFLHTFKIFL